MRQSKLAVLLLMSVATVTLTAGCENSRQRMARMIHKPAPSEKPGRAVVLSEDQVSDIQVSLARTLEQKGDLPGAMDGYRHVLELDPSNAIAAWRLAVLYDRQGQSQQSETWYTKALKQDPDNPDILADFGYSLYLKQRWPESEQHLTTALKLSPGNPRIQNNLGLLYSQTDRTSDALAAFQKSGCSHADACANIGLVATINGDSVTARSMFEKSLAVNPSCETARCGLAALKNTRRASAIQQAHAEDLTDPLQLTNLNDSE
jgi:Tfp pilus assembly protein PilF